MEGHTKRRPLAACMQMLGTVILALLVLLCVPLTVPRLFGYHIYSVISGSMEPKLPIGSLIYIEETEPKELEKGEVIAFYGAADTGAIITHRVVENRVVMGELTTKGDANEKEDMQPVAYRNVIGRVAWSVPGMGRAAEILTSTRGKALAGGMVVLAVVLQIAGSWIDRRQ